MLCAIVLAVYVPKYSRRRDAALIFAMYNSGVCPIIPCDSVFDHSRLRHFEAAPHSSPVVNFPVYSHGMRDNGKHASDE
jgi:hypothetical protein